MKIEKYFKLAKEVSQNSTYRKQHLGAVIVYKNKAISTGFNTNKTSPAQAKYNHFRGFNPYESPSYEHAEMAALMRIPKGYSKEDYGKMKIFIYREHKGTGKTILARPCAACEQALKDFGIKELYYTGNDSIVYERYNNEK